MTDCPTSFNLAAYVLQHASAQPDKVALAILGPARAERWSYGRLEAAVRGVATGLLAAGFHPGDRILIRLENTVAFPLAYLGAIAVGLVPIPSSSQLTTPELDKLTPLVRPSGTIAAPGVALPSEAGIVIDEVALMAMEHNAPAPYDVGDPNRMAYAVFTSGTSGQPRAVVHAHRAIWARRMMWDGWYDLRPDDRLLHAGAFNWTFTLGTGLMDPWSRGATALIPADGVAVDMLPLLLARHDATLFAGAPGIFRRLLRAPDRLSLPKLRHAFCAGEHLPDTLRRDWKNTTGTGLYDAYGMTECSTFLSANPGGAPSLTPQPGRKVAVIKDGQAVQDIAGTIAISQDDPGLMLGYLNGNTIERPVANGWFLTGDRAMQSADGRITYLGRNSDLLNAGGFRASPLEIEAALSTLDGIEDIAVTEIEVKADTIVIAAAYTGPFPMDETDLNAHAAAHLARYKHPRVWKHVPALPRGANGKLLRRALPDLWST